jgi:hypothetical protein
MRMYHVQSGICWSCALYDMHYINLKFVMGGMS